MYRPYCAVFGEFARQRPEFAVVSWCGNRHFHSLLPNWDDSASRQLTHGSFSRTNGQEGCVSYGDDVPVPVTERTSRVLDTQLANSQSRYCPPALLSTITTLHLSPSRLRLLLHRPDTCPAHLTNYLALHFVHNTLRQHRRFLCLIRKNTVFGELTEQHASELSPPISGSTKSVFSQVSGAATVAFRRGRVPMDHSRAKETGTDFKFTPKSLRLHVRTKIGLTGFGHMLLCGITLNDTAPRGSAQLNRQTRALTKRMFITLRVFKGTRPNTS
ncbi:hypothetical protein BC827DRAFT_945260 [Russula dissimulans]|nr:hypothetical protein BC827DRAFT_945260 [Russula dissimulans]